MAVSVAMNSLMMSQLVLKLKLRFQISLNKNFKSIFSYFSQISFLCEVFLSKKILKINKNNL